MLCRCLRPASSTTRLTSVFVIRNTCSSFPTACHLGGDGHHRGSELRVESRTDGDHETWHVSMEHHQNGKRINTAITLSSHPTLWKKKKTPRATAMPPKN